MLSLAIAIVIHLLVALSLFLAASAHFSGDPSGIQYVFIVWGWAVAAVAALIALTALALGRLVHPRLAATLVLTAFFWPALPGIIAEYGDAEWRDPLGQVISVVVAVVQCGLFVWQARRFRMNRFKRSALASA